MNKTVKTAIIAIAIVAIVLLAGFLIWKATSKEEGASSKLEINSQEGMTALVDQIYAKIPEGTLPALQTTVVDVSDANLVKSFTGLDSAENIEYIVASEPMMSSQAYSMVLVKVKSGADANNIAKTMNENIDIRKWICVSAEKVYTATSGDIICLVMSNADNAKLVYDNFKTLAGSVQKEYERTEEEPELPPEMF